MQFYLLMKDYGGRNGLESIVHPEDTRSDIIIEVRDLITRDQVPVVFVKFIDGNHIFDCTEEIVDAARAQILTSAE